MDRPSGRLRNNNNNINSVLIIIIIIMSGKIRFALASKQPKIVQTHERKNNDCFWTQYATAIEIAKKVS